MMEMASPEQAALKVKRTSQDDQIYEQMFAAILEQRLTPGTKLSEDTLGEIFGVSRTIIRKILQRLAYEKVVQILPNRGAFVAEPTPEEAKEVLEARRIVEAAIMSLVVKSHNARDLEQLEDNLRAEAKTIEAGQHSQWVALSGNFHLLLAKIAGNRTLEDYLRELVSRTSLIHIQYQSNKIAIQSCSCDEHAELIRAIRARDEPKAVQLMLVHIEEIEKSLNLDGKETASDLYEIFGNRQKQIK